jgi:hypothetical protein
MVHRNNVYAGLTRALAERFPLCRRLVGEGFFRAMAGAFIELAPPRAPILALWGDDLPAFLALFPPARSVPFLPDMARLEIARSRAFNAADAEPLGAAALAAVAPDAWPRARLVLHPSLGILASRHPIVSIWAAHAEDAAPPPTIVSGRPETALVARPDATVETSAIGPGEAAFIESLARGRSVVAALGDASAVSPGIDLAACIGAVVRSRIIVGVLPP